MRPHISLITLAVEDLQRAVVFYRDGLGLPTNGIMGTEFEIGAVAFFNLQPNLKLAVWPRTSLAADTGLPLPVVAQAALVLPTMLLLKTRLMMLCSKHAKLVQQSLSPQAQLFGVAMPVTFKIQTVTFGKSHSIQKCPFN